MCSEIFLCSKKGITKSINERNKLYLMSSIRLSEILILFKPFDLVLISDVTLLDDATYVEQMFTTEVVRYRYFNLHVRNFFGDD